MRLDHSKWESRMGELRAKASQIALRPRRICKWDYPGCTPVVDEGEPGALVTHTICPACKKALGIELDRLDKLEKEAA